MPSELFSYILSISPDFRKPKRLSSLYADFPRLKATNPEGYTANILAWQSVLSRALLAGRISNSAGDNDLLTLQVGEELKEELETEDGSRPVGLGWVVSESLKSKAMMPLKDFLLARESMYRRDWSEVPWRIVEWGLEKAGLTGWVGEKAAFGRFVVLGNVEEAAKRVLKQASGKHTSATDRIYSLEGFKNEYSHVIGTEVPLSETDFSVLLTFLRRDKGAISYDGKLIVSRTIKFPSANGNLEPITTEDTSIASLVTLISSLRLQTESISTRITTLTAQAQNSLTSKNRTAALSAIRSRKLAELTLKQRSDTLAQLEEVLTGIEQASGQIEIVSVLEGSRDALRGLNKQVGGVERVEDVLEELREGIGKVDEVSEALREGASGTVDEDEVDEELAAMEAEEKRAREEKEIQERIAREEREAEETKQRLAEIVKKPEAEIPTTEGKEKSRIEAQMGGSVEATGVAEDKKNSNPIDNDADIEDSIKRLSQMSVEDAAPPKEERSSKEHLDRAPAQALPAD